MILGLYFFDHLFDPSLCVDDEGSTQSAHVLTSVVGFHIPGAVELVHGMIRIGNEGKGEVLLVDKALVGGLGILADAQHHIAVVEELVVMVAEVAGLGCAAGSGVFGVEIEDDFFAKEITK